MFCSGIQISYIKKIHLILHFNKKHLISDKQHITNTIKHEQKNVGGFN